MGLVKVTKNLSLSALNEAKKDYQNYIKITLDIKKKIVILGGEYHADAEKLLLDEGSQQENIWGGGVDLKSKNFDTSAIINLRRGNDSTEILNPQKRKLFLKLSKNIFKNYVK